MDKRIVYTYEDALKASLDYFNGDDLAAKVWISKYALKDSEGNLYEKSPEDMHWRITKEISRIEQKYVNPISEDEIFNLLDRFKYIVPQGSPMSGIGNNEQTVSLSNCFVIGTEPAADSYGGILRTDEEQVQLMKRRGGVGHDLSHLRPAKTKVNNSAITSTGVVSFMERYSNSTREVAQDGRRGALMLSISIDQPDSEAFIDAKLETDKITGANISVRISDSFMKAALADEEYMLRYPVDSDIEHASITKSINAGKLWKKIVHNAWKSAEPGILFWDKIIKESPADCYKDVGFKTVSTNPCAELPLCLNDSCRLLVLNLYSYVKYPFTDKAVFDFDLFKYHAKIATRIMDDIVDLELEKIDAILAKIEKDPETEDIKSVEKNLWIKIREKAKNGRRLGIGITAEGDMLAALNLRYGSEDAILHAVKVHKILATGAYRESVNLAKERGSFPIWDFDKEFPSYGTRGISGMNDDENNPFLARIFDTIYKDDMDGNVVWNEYQKYGRRNIAMLTIAPTGSTSMMTQSTSGIEPVFMPVYKRNKKVNPNDKDINIAFIDKSGDAWEQFYVFHPKFAIWLDLNGYSIEEVKKMKNEDVETILKKSPYYLATSQDVDWIAKVKMQGEIQKWIDHSISMTCNLPESATEEMVSKVYETAWKSGCKGVTVYRDGSRQGVLVADTKEEPTQNQRNGAMIIKNNAPKRPKSLPCNLHYVTALGKKWLVIVGLLNGDPYEVFAVMEKSVSLSKSITTGKLVKVKTGHYSIEFESGGILDNITELFERSEEEALTRTISMALRHGVDMKYIVEQLNKSEGTIISFSKAISRTLIKYSKDPKLEDKKCPNCGDPEGLYREGGCIRCASCSYTGHCS